MSGRCLRVFVVALVWGSYLFSRPIVGAAEPGNELVQMVLDLLGDKSPDLRSAGLEQVRTEAKGTEATKKFAAQLPKLAPEAQVALASALADRGDNAARPALLELLAATSDPLVRVAVIKSLGALGEPADLPILLKYAESKTAEEQEAAQTSLVRMPGKATNSAIAAQVKTASPALRSVLADVLAARHAFDTLPELLPGAVDRDPAVRVATMSALAKLAGATEVPVMMQGVLKARKGGEREAAEKAVVSVCSRIEDEAKRAQLVLASLEKASEKEQLVLLSILGRLGGSSSLEFLEKGITGSSKPRRTASLEALCKWPDASIADRLLALAKDAKDPYERDLTYRAFVRVGAMRDKDRTEKDRFERLQQALAIAKTDDDRLLVVKTSRMAYCLESLHFVLPYLDQPAFAPVACETIVELAHHRELREPNKPEFDKALDRVLAISSDEVVQDRAKRYKAGQTWYRPKRETTPIDLAAGGEEEEEAENEESAENTPVLTNLWLAVAGGALLLVFTIVGYFSKGRGPRNAAP